jgi:hypothetical protein
MEITGGPPNLFREPCSIVWDLNAGIPIKGALDVIASELPKTPLGRGYQEKVFNHQY